MTEQNTPPPTPQGAAEGSKPLQKKKTGKTVPKINKTVAGTVAAVLVVLCLGFWLFGGSARFSSDSDIENFLNERVSLVNEIDPKASKEVEKAVNTACKGLRKDATDEQKSVLIELVTMSGKVEALAYLFEEKDFGAAEAAVAFVEAARAGRVEIMKYLVEKKLAGDKSQCAAAFMKALGTGRVDVLEYLVEELSVRPEDVPAAGSIYNTLFSMTGEMYNEEVQFLVQSGRRITLEELQQQQVAALEYLAGLGAGPAASGFPYPADAGLEKCPNPYFVQFLKREQAKAK